jgi:hypothetical protein
MASKEKQTTLSSFFNKSQGEAHNYSDCITVRHSKRPLEPSTTKSMKRKREPLSTIANEADKAPLFATLESAGVSGRSIFKHVLSKYFVLFSCFHIKRAWRSSLLANHIERFGLTHDAI